MTREPFIVWSLLAATFAIRSIQLDQPIVENYVGRQIPTAMVARNLERGSGFFHPQLDTGPFPNLFLVEPPLYAQLVVAVRPLIGFDLEPTGRLVSAAATALAAWGLYGLARRREGVLVALLALASFGLFPVMIRYGRAFQPDALMLGCILAGLRGWDEFEERGNWRWAAFGGFVLSTGLALKVTSAWALIPYVVLLRRWPICWRLAAAAAMLAPALGWYVNAWFQVAAPSSGSLASFDNSRIWLRAFSLGSWLRLGTYENLVRGLVMRSFTPVGFALTFWGLLGSGKLDRLWQAWALGCALSILGLSSKWHHSYYWMVVAPLAAVAVARGLVNLGQRGSCWRPLAPILASCFLVACLMQSASTWRIPVEWAGLVETAKLVASLTAKDELVVAPEALLYYADRKGYRLEFDRAASIRAIGEWGLISSEPQGPLTLTETYWTIHSPQSTDVRWTSNSTVFHPSSSDHLLMADVGSEVADAGRRGWRSALRSRRETRILVDRPDVMIAELR